MKPLLDMHYKSETCESLCFVPGDCRERFLNSVTLAKPLLHEHEIVNGGLSEVVPDYHVRRRNESFNLVLYSIRGEAELILKGKKIPFTPGHVLIAGAPSTYEYYATGRWTLLWFHMWQRSPWNYLFSSDAFLRPARCLNQLLHTAEDCLEKSHQNYPDIAVVNSVYANLVSVLLQRELRRDLSVEESLVIAKFESLWEEVRNDVIHQWTTSEMARKIGMSERHFQRACSKLYGQTPMKIVTGLRIEQAKTLLMTSRETLDGIAVSVGYNNGFNLSRAFKRETGMTPRQFRNIS